MQGQRNLSIVGMDPIWHGGIYGLNCCITFTEKYVDEYVINDIWTYFGNFKCNLPREYEKATIFCLLGL